MSDILALLDEDTPTSSLDLSVWRRRIPLTRAASALCSSKTPTSLSLSSSRTTATPTATLHPAEDGPRRMARLLGKARRPSPTAVGRPKPLSDRWWRGTTAAISDVWEDCRSSSWLTGRRRRSRRNPHPPRSAFRRSARRSVMTVAGSSTAHISLPALGLLAGPQRPGRAPR